MKRQDFLKILGATGSTFLLGNLAYSADNLSFEMRKITIYDNYVRGVNFYRDGFLALKLEQNQQVRLKREAENVYDQYAVSVWIGEVQVGYIASYENVILANLLENGVQLYSYISELRTVDTHDYLKDVMAVRIEAELMVPIGGVATIKEGRADNAIDVYRQGMI